MYHFCKVKYGTLCILLEMKKSFITSGPGPSQQPTTHNLPKRCLSRVLRLHGLQDHRSSGPAVIKLFSGSTQLSMKFFLLINVKMPTIYEQEKQHSRLI